MRASTLALATLTFCFSPPAEARGHKHHHHRAHHHKHHRHHHHTHHTTVHGDYTRLRTTEPGGEGRASWFSQFWGTHVWRDTGDRPGSNALGVPDSEQGIALRSRRTLGQWFFVTLPDGRMFHVQQTDIGPARRTGKSIDVSAAAAEAMGYTPKSFPTGSRFQWNPAPEPEVPTIGQQNSGGHR